MGEPSPLRNPLGTRGSACVEVMTTLHRSTHLLRGVQRVAYRQRASLDPIKISFLHMGASVDLQSCLGGFTVTDLDSPLWIRVGGKLTRVSGKSNQRSDQRDMDS
ncbi:hypothetical protein CK203_104011 [Vitis vinifera]|uniref:Uncharacterized protein n=1 Tax=Vitis vinifera TaxID=29760 RepID=A0A438FFQ7_VITVI|nr:hypothetical protein CK203_104011 [Vitis vinifera]